MIFRKSCVIGMIILMIFCLSACWKARTYAEVFKNNWGIDLPENMEEVFYTSDSGRDGRRYAVLKLEEESADFIADFSREKNEEFENTINKIISGAYLEYVVPVNLKIPVNLLPDWKAAYYWKHTGKGASETRVYWDNVYMIYFPDSLRLIICESFF